MQARRSLDLTFLLLEGLGRAKGV